MELAIEKERTEARGVKATTCNLFVHGLEEQIDETPVEKMRDDGEFVSDTIMKMGI